MLASPYSNGKGDTIKALRRFAILWIVAMGWSSSAVGAVSSSAIPVYPIDALRYTDPHQYSFLDPLLRDVDVVSLGESIHLTHEFPLVRLGIVRHLNESLGFHTLAMEGSAEDIWIAQDRFLNSAGSSKDAGDAQLGLFNVWNTPEVKKLFEYEASSWKSATPLYVTSYDIQPGTGIGSWEYDVFWLLTERLKHYAPPASGFNLLKLLDELGPLTSGCAAYAPTTEQSSEKGIQLLDEWIQRAAPEVQRRFPNVPHAAVLRLIPANLHASLQLCQNLIKDRRSYKGLRDTLAADYALQLKSQVPGQKLMLWAHISHLSLNHEHHPASVGEKLHASLGRSLYTIGAFAEGGGTVLIYNDARNDIGYTWVHGKRSDFGKLMSQRCEKDCFVDFRTLESSTQSLPEFATPQLFWGEGGVGGTVQLAPDQDFDGIIWIKRLHPPDLPLRKLLMLSLPHYWAALIVIAAVVVLSLVMLVFSFFRRRKKVVTLVE